MSEIIVSIAQVVVMAGGILVAAEELQNSKDNPIQKQGESATLSSSRKSFGAACHKLTMWKQRYRIRKQ